MKSRYDVQAHFKEFPFLHRVRVGTWHGEPDEWCSENGCTKIGVHSHPTYLGTKQVAEVRISRISPELLNNSSYVEMNDEDSYFYFNKEHEMILKVEEDETLGEALLRLDDPDDVIDVVLLESHDGYNGKFSVVVYLSPKGFTLREWVEKQEQHAEARVKAEIAKIDAEATVS